MTEHACICVYIYKYICVYIYIYTHTNELRFVTGGERALSLNFINSIPIRL